MVSRLPSTEKNCPVVASHSWFRRMVGKNSFLPASGRRVVLVYWLVQSNGRALQSDCPPVVASGVDLGVCIVRPQSDLLCASRHLRPSVFVIKGSRRQPPVSFRLVSLPISLFGFLVHPAPVPLLNILLIPALPIQSSNDEVHYHPLPRSRGGSRHHPGMHHYHRCHEAHSRTWQILQEWRAALEEYLWSTGHVLFCVS